MKTDNIIVISILSFFTGTLIGIIIDQKPFELYFPIIGSAMATLVAAYLGAGYAFKLQNDHNEKKILEHNISVGNRAIFTLVRMQK